MSHNKSLLTDALLRVFPPWPRDQFGRMVTDESSAQALMSHALQHVGPRCSSVFLRLPKTHQRTDAIQTKIWNTRFVYPTCHLKGFSKLEKEMAVANKLLASSGDTNLHRIWRKGQWNTVTVEEEVESLNNAEGRLLHNNRTPCHLWLEPKSVPLSRCVAAEGPAVLHRWSSVEHHVHVDQMDRGKIPYSMRVSRHYFASNGRQIAIPSTQSATSTAVSPKSENVIHTTKDMFASMRERSQLGLRESNETEQTEAPPPLTTCWFLQSELPGKQLEKIPGRPVYHVAHEDQHICIPLNEGFTVVDGEVRSGFLAAYPPPPAELSSAPCVRIFQAETKEWSSCSLDSCVGTFGVNETLRSAACGDILLVNVATAEELGLISWSDDRVRLREYFSSPATNDVEEDALLQESVDEADAMEPLETVIDASTMDELQDDVQEKEQCATSWGEGRRTTRVSTAVANAHVLPAHVLRDLAQMTTAHRVPPSSPCDSTALVMAEDIAGILLVTVCSYLAVVNAADVQRVL